MEVLEKREADGSPGALEPTIEEALAQIDALVERMGTDGISLEESFDCYEKGIRLIRYCDERIDRVEKKVRMLRGEGEAPLEGTAADGV